MNDPQGDLWVIDFEGGARVRLAERDAANPVWSPDEREIAYARLDSAGIPKMFVRLSDGSGSERALAAEPVAQVPTGWSPDGRYILYNRGATGNSHIWAVPVTPVGKPFPVVQTEVFELAFHHRHELEGGIGEMTLVAGTYLGRAGEVAMTDTRKESKVHV